ncbi:MAG: IS630 family transposase [Phycisphaeraceae bacterium]|nr:IS630 family transposase [Phycisphaeraceae bacterium]
MRRANPIMLNETQRQQLERLRRGRRVPVRLAERAAIVLHAADGLENQQIAQVMGISRYKVSRWRGRYAAGGLSGIERDAPRPGRKRRIDDQRRAAVVRKALREKPDGQTHWSRATMAAATGLSDSTIGRIWREHGLQPHRVETFKLSNDPQFVEKLRDIIGLYVTPPEHAIVLSCDEKSQIQALDRTQPGLPIKPGRCGTMTHDYKRHGTASLFAALNVLDGTIISQCQRRHRHQEWLKFLKLIESQVPAGQDVHLICDNYATHKHPKVRAWAKRHPRFYFHFTPTGALWLNMVERFFRDLSDKAIKRGSFYHVNDLIGAITEYINQHNENPKPFIWTASATDILAKVKRARRVLDKL